MFYDAAVFYIYTFLVSYRWGFNPGRSFLWCFLFVTVLFAATTLIRILCRVYSQVWRYGGIQSYIRLLVSDALAFLLVSFVYLVLKWTGTGQIPGGFSMIFLIAVCGINCLTALSMRMFYRYVCKCGNRQDFIGKLMRGLLLLFAGKSVAERFSVSEEAAADTRVPIAIVGAGNTGVTLAEDLSGNPNAAFRPDCFIETDPAIIGRQIYGLPVFDSRAATPEFLHRRGVKEIVFALPHMDNEKRAELYAFYKNGGFRVNVYDYPVMESASANRKKSIRQFDIEDLLFRKQMNITTDSTRAYYAGKKILVTGGGGSIGSELARQVAAMEPAELILLDVYENGVYDLQQELKIAYAEKLKLSVEILSVCNREALERVFSGYRPDIVIHAAAHKHVPLMEHNCCEAVENNIFGTLNAVELSEKYGVGRFIMVSTDKAVNPTNVMGATKRFCEMIVMQRAAVSKITLFSATRFGNVLGSAGSVIPLFKRLIAAGGPVTVTDKRIIRYFMTIPEASQLVLQSGSMAKKGELFVLDMGKPVRILELAENMISLSGFRPYADIDIVETGLRPGEKLYEELLMKSETLAKTESDLIFIEKDDPVTAEELADSLRLLREAVLRGDDGYMRMVLMQTVPTFRKPEDVNRNAGKSAEMAASAAGIPAGNEA